MKNDDHHIINAINRFDFRITMKATIVFYGVLALGITLWACLTSMSVAVNDAPNISRQRGWQEIIWNNSINSTCTNQAQIKTVMFNLSEKTIDEGSCKAIWLVLLPPGEYYSIFKSAITPVKELDYVKVMRSNISAVILDDYQFAIDFFNQIYSNLSKITEVIPVLYYFSLIYFPQILEYPISDYSALNNSRHIVLVVRPSSIMQTQKEWESFTTFAISQMRLLLPNVASIVLEYATQTTFWHYPISRAYLNGVGNASYVSSGLVIWGVYNASYTAWFPDWSRRSR
jgi:hypothetical protein